MFVWVVDWSKVKIEQQKLYKIQLDQTGNMVSILIDQRLKYREALHGQYPDNSRLIKRVTFVSALFDTCIAKYNNKKLKLTWRIHSAPFSFVGSLGFIFNFNGGNWSWICRHTMLCIMKKLHQLTPNNMRK